MSRSREAVAAPLFAALGDETRLRLVTRLALQGPGNLTALLDAAPMTRQAISKHLGVLESAGLVRSERVGRERMWQLEPKRLSDAHAYLDRISAQWDDAIARLRAFVETD